MRSFADDLNVFTRRHVPAAVSLVRYIRTKRYRSHRTKKELRERLDLVLHDLARFTSRPVKRETKKAQRLTRTPIVEINNTCNIDCVMCKTSLSTRKKGKMSSEILGVALDRFGEMGISGVELHTIGDPLANPNLPLVLEELRKRRLATAITTNGLLLHRHWEALLKYRDVCKGVTISIDGATKDTYERIRFGGKWEALLENLDIARKNLKGKIPLLTTMIVSKDNIKEIGQYISIFRDLVQEPSRDMGFSALNSLSPETTYFESMNLFAGYTHKNINCHYVSGESLYALVDGRVSVCCRDYDGSLIVGDLRKQSVPEIWASSDLAKLQAAHESQDLLDFPLCNSCYVVDQRARDGLSLFMKYLLHGRANKTAEFYQWAAESFIHLLSAGPPIDFNQLNRLMTRIDTGDGYA